MKKRGKGVVYGAFSVISVNASVVTETGKVRLGFTVGKKNAHRAVDRVLVKRIMRESSRMLLPELVRVSQDGGFGLEIGLRLRCPIGRIGTDVSVIAAKETVRKACDSCLDKVLAFAKEYKPSRG